MEKIVLETCNLSNFNICYFFQNSSVYLLQIKDIQEKDAGLYRCQVLAPSGHIITADVELQVRGPPFIFANSTRSIVASEGEGTNNIT